MKPLYISALLFLFVAHPLMAQEKTAMEGEKTKVYTLFGKTWQVTKYAGKSLLKFFKIGQFLII